MRVISRGGHGLAGRGPEPTAAAGGLGWEVFKVSPNLFHSYSNYSSAGLSERLSPPPPAPHLYRIFLPPARERDSTQQRKKCVCL